MEKNKGVTTKPQQKTNKPEAPLSPDAGVGSLLPTRGPDTPPARQVGAPPRSGGKHRAPTPTPRALPPAAAARADPTRPHSWRFAQTPGLGAGEPRSSARPGGVPSLRARRQERLPRRRAEPAGVRARAAAPAPGEARRSEAKQAPAMAGQESPGPAAATAPSRPPPPAPGLSPGRGPPQLQPRRATHARHRTMEHEPPSSPRPAQPGRGKLPARLPSAHMRTAKLPAPGGRAPRLLGAGCLASARALSVRGVEVRHGVVVSGASAPHGEPRREGRGWLNTGVLTTAPEYGGGWREVGAGSSRCASGRGCTQGLSGEGPASVLVLKGFWRPIPRQLSGAWLKGASSPKNGVGISWWTWAAWPGKCARA